MSLHRSSVATGALLAALIAAAVSGCVPGAPTASPTASTSPSSGSEAEPGDDGATHAPSEPDPCDDAFAGRVSELLGSSLELADGAEGPIAPLVQDGDCVVRSTAIPTQWLAFDLDATDADYTARIAAITAAGAELQGEQGAEVSLFAWEGSVGSVSYGLSDEAAPVLELDQPYLVVDWTTAD